MKPTCLIIDDEPIAAAGLAEDLQTLGLFTVAGIAHSAAEAIQKHRTSPVDLFLLDIELPGCTGIQLLKELSVRPMTIFITAYQQYALQGYEYGVIDYLLKPVSPSRLKTACEKALEQYNLRRPMGSLLIKCDGSYFRIGHQEITHLEAANNYVWIHTSERKYMVYQSLRSLEQQLPRQEFAQIHKSYIVGCRYVREITGSTVVLQNIRLPLSRRFRTSFLQQVTNNSNPVT